MALRTDSRTLKQVMSVHRLGYSSAVVEGPPSRFPAGTLPVDVLSTLPPPPSAEPATTDSQAPNIKPHPKQTAAFDAQTGPGAALPPATNTSESRVSSSETRTITSRALRYGRLLILAPFFFLLRALDFIRIKLSIIKNRIIYNNISAFLKHALQYFKSYVLPIWKSNPRARLYYIHSPYQYPGVYLNKLRYNSKHIYDAHDFYSNMETAGSVSTFWERWIVPFETYIEKRCVRSAAAVVTVNDGLAGLIAEKYGVKPLVLRNSHDQRLDEAVDVGIRVALGLTADHIIIACVGNWKRENGVSQAIEAMAGLDARYHLAFMGAGFPSYSAQIEALGLSGRVHFLPPVRPTQVVPFIRSANIGLILYHDGAPGVRWSLPNRFFQPVAAGLPILYPELPEIARLARQYELGLPIDTLDADSIRSGIRDLTNAPELFDACRRNALAAGTTLGWEQDEIKLATLIADTIGPPREARSDSQETHPVRP